jgi:hypothetical protein
VCVLCAACTTHTRVHVVRFPDTLTSALCVLRACVQTGERARVWDQDLYKKVMIHCVKAYSLRWHALSPRHLNSYCYKPCGCDYSDADVAERPEKELRPAPFASKDDSGTCAADAVSRWMLMHFPCGGEAEHKRELMDKYARMWERARLGPLIPPESS